MKLTIESTSKIIELRIGDALVPARVWEGKTESGVPVQAFITRVAVKRTEDCSELERDLAEQKQPSAEAQAWPLRLVL